jgi:hypothetical protein
MHRVRRGLATLSTVTLLSACGPGGHEPPHDGSITVTVTLSRSGPPGPSLDHVPQKGIAVTASNHARNSWSGTTDVGGAATLTVPAGAYDVDISFCPDAPHHVTATPGATTETRFDCLAA